MEYKIYLKKKKVMLDDDKREEEWNEVVDWLTTDRILDWIWYQEGLVGLYGSQVCINNQNDLRICTCFIEG